MSDRSYSLQEDTHYRLLRQIESDASVSQRELAQKLGISLGAVNYCLKALVAKGLIKVENFRASQRKLRYIYVLTPQGVATRAKLTLKFLNRKLTEYECLREEIESLQREVRRGAASEEIGDLEKLRKS